MGIEFKTRGEAIEWINIDSAVSKPQEPTFPIVPIGETVPEVHKSYVEEVFEFSNSPVMQSLQTQESDIAALLATSQLQYRVNRRLHERVKRNLTAESDSLTATQRNSHSSKIMQPVHAIGRFFAERVLYPQGISTSLSARRELAEVTELLHEVNIAGEAEILESRERLQRLEEQREAVRQEIGARMLDWITDEEYRVIAHASSFLSKDLGRREKLYDTFASKQGLEKELVHEVLESSVCNYDPEIRFYPQNADVPTEPGRIHMQIDMPVAEEAVPDWREWYKEKRETNGETILSVERSKPYRIARIVPSVKGNQSDALLLDEEKLESYIAQQALKLPTESMRQALPRAIEYLQETPLGDATKSLKRFRGSRTSTITVGFTRYNLRSLSPGKIPDVVLSKDESGKFRIYYAVCKVDGVDMVVIKDIEGNHDFRKK